MKIQFIFTFDSEPQIITEYDILFPAFLESKKVFTAYALSQLEEKEIEGLIKVSCSICEVAGREIPKWYDECRGKLWVDDLEPFKIENNINTTVSEDYIKDFLNNN